MSAIIRGAIIGLVVLLQACGGSGGSDSKSPRINSSAPMSSAAAIISSSSMSSIRDSISSSVSSLSDSSINSSMGGSIDSPISSSISSSSNSSSSAESLPTGTVDTLPVLNITTDDGAPIISKETYLNASFTLSGEGITAVAGTTEIRGRGNSTWDWDKKPYRLKLSSSTEILGMPASKHWVLLANYADKTLMRNDVAFMFSRQLGMEYTPRNQYVELTLNGAYQGVYQLVEHIRVAKDRVNIPELKVADTDAEKITGGYLLEVDFRMTRDFCDYSPWASFCVDGVNMEREATFCVDSTHGMNPFCLDTPETLLEPTWLAQREYIDNYITDTEAALFDENFADPELGYAAYIDVDSAVNYYLINELFKNADGAAASFYLYKKRNGKLFFGPIWDFDLSMGNAGYSDLDKTYGWHIRESSWFERLFEDPAFKAKVSARWNSLKAEGKLDYIFQYAEARAIWLDKQQQKNYLLWSVTDFADWIWHGANGGTGSYEAETTEMIRWQRERYEWMDTQLNQ